jgi:hypothetical protein
LSIIPPDPEKNAIKVRTVKVKIKLSITWFTESSVKIEVESMFVRRKISFLFLSLSAITPLSLNIK